MLRLAQCEKAVTISELMGRTPEGPRVPTGSKTPLRLLSLVLASLVSEGEGASYFCLTDIFHCVFNSLQTEEARLLMQFGGPVPYVQEGNFLPTRGARFGPNFVTIQPIGVCVCSI